jgi:hypothetical protein
MADRKNALAPSVANGLTQTAANPLARVYQAYQQHIGQPFQQAVRGGVRGYFGLPMMSDASALGREAYGQGVALSNVPGVGAPAGAAKVAAQALGALPETAMFIGALAKTWDAASNAKATKMEAQGVDPRVIWKETGNWRGPDGQWRQEISDKAAQYVGGPQGAPAGQVMSHPELQAAYPDLMQTPVYEKPTTDISAFRQGRIDLGTQQPKDAKSALLHELQHPIQEKEGFAKGGTPEPSVRQADAILELDPIIDEYRELWRSLRGQERPKTPLGLSLKETDIEDFYESVRELKDPNLRKRFEEILNKIDVKRQNLFGPDEGVLAQQRSIEEYRKLAGEAEARATQARMGLTQQQRRELFPAQSYDIPLNELTIRR